MPEQVSEATPVFLRNSERKTYRTCRLQWEWKYVRGLSSPRPRGALSFGTGVHYALELYYPPGTERGPHPAATFEQWYNEQEQAFDQWDDEGNRVDALELGIAMLNGYVDRYGAEDHIRIVAPEMPMSVELRDKQGRYLCTWVGKTDALYEDLSKSNRKRKRLGFFEHKTAKSIESNLRVNSGYGDQGLAYAWSGSMFLREQGILQPGENVDHVLFNWLRKGIPDTRPVSADGYRLNRPTKDALFERLAFHGEAPKKSTKVDDLMALLETFGEDPLMLGEPAARQPSPLFERYAMDYGDGEMEQTEWRIRAEAWEREQVRAGKLPIYKNPSKDCSWQCEFVEACELHEMGGDWESVLELEFEDWDPYSDHDKEIK